MRHHSLATAASVRTSRGSRRGVAGRAFSIIEIIVVVVLIGVLATMVVPRIAVFMGRSTQAAAQRAAGVLSAAARRDALTSQRVAVEFDAEAGVLRMVVLTEDGEAWVRDPLTPAESLGQTRVEQASADSALLEGSWRVEFSQSQLRPALSLLLTDARGNDPYRVELGARAARAVVSPGRGIGGAELDGAIDLDATGRETQAW